jgi:hypothetical protein
MSELSNFESRSGKLTCNSEEFFAFITDIRNLERFIPKNSISNWYAEKEICSFSVSMLGAVTVRLTQKEKFTKVVFNGDALKKNDFSLTLDFSNGSGNGANIRVMLNADLNPMMRMVAAKPINQFLEMIINEMEKFRDWKDTKE